MPDGPGGGTVARKSYGQHWISGTGAESKNTVSDNYISKAFAARVGME